MRITLQEHDALQELNSADLSAAGHLRKLFISLVVIANEKLEEPATTNEQSKPASRPLERLSSDDVRLTHNHHTLRQ